MTPAVTTRALTARHDQILDELDAVVAGQIPRETLRTTIERHRKAIHLSAFWLLSEIRVHHDLRARYEDATTRLHDHLDVLGPREARQETRRVIDEWLRALTELVDAAAHETTDAGRELLVRAYQNTDQPAAKRTENSVPASLD